MTFPELMQAIRASYVEVLAAAVADREPALREAALRRADGSLGLDGDPPTPVRVDLIDAGGQRTIDAARQLRFDAFSFELSGMQVTVSPFTWDWLALAVDGDGATATQACAEWFMRWFDAQDEQEPSDDGLRRVVHHMTDAVATLGGIELHVDLGSVSDEAVDDLLFSLAQAGMRAARLGA